MEHRTSQSRNSVATILAGAAATFRNITRREVFPNRAVEVSNPAAEKQHHLSMLF
jgi:hypothetical protein